MNKVTDITDALLEVAQADIEEVLDEATRMTTGGIFVMVDKEVTDEVFKEYLRESVHSNLDGADVPWMIGAAEFLKDVLLYARNR